MLTFPDEQDTTAMSLPEELDDIVPTVLDALTLVEPFEDDADTVA